MSFARSSTAEGHLRDIFVGSISDRPTLTPSGLACVAGEIAGLGWHDIATIGGPDETSEVGALNHLRFQL